MVKSLNAVTMGDRAAKLLPYFNSMEKVHRLSFGSSEQQEYGASKGVGEIPLNGKGMPLHMKGEEIVGTHMKV